MLNLDAQAPSFSLKGVDGNPYSLNDLKGDRGIVVVFSCNHCPYVKAYEDRMIELANEYQSRGIPFALINANDPVNYPDDDFEAMAERAQEKGYPFPYLQDETQETATAYGAERTPEVFLFDGDLRLQYHGRIDDNYEDPSAVQQAYLKDALEAVLSDETPPVRMTDPVGCTIKWKS